LATKKVPERMCIACGQMKPKKELLRIVRSEEGIYPDPTGKADGRGAYVCHTPECFELLVKKRALNRAYKASIGDDVYAALKERLSELNG